MPVTVKFNSIINFFLILNPIFVILSFSFSGITGYTIKLTTITLVWVVIYLFISSNKLYIDRAIYSKSILCFFAFILLINISFVRACMNGLISYQQTGFFISYLSSYFILGYTLFYLNIDIKLKESFIYSILISIPIYIFINIILFFLNIEILHSDEILNQSKALLLDKIGIEFYRSYLPLAEGINGAGILCGLSAVISYYLLKCYKGNIIINSFYILIFLSAILGMLITDTRGGIFYFILTILFSYFLFKHNKVLKWFPWISPLVFLVLAFGIFYFQSIFPDLNRSNTSILAGREILWFLSIEKLLQFDYSNIFGQGYLGHEILNVFGQYFTFLEREEHFTTTHNFILQYIFDIGIAGTVLTISLLFYIIKNIINSNDNLSLNKLLIPVFVFYILSGFTEVSINFYHKIMFNIFILFAWYGISLDRTNELKPGQVK